MKALNFDPTNIRSLNKENLKEFGSKLKFLGLGNNKLTSINADLVEYMVLIEIPSVTLNLYSLQVLKTFNKLHTSSVSSQLVA